MPAPSYDPLKDKSKWCYGMSHDEYIAALKQGRGVPQIDIQFPDQKTGYILDEVEKQMHENIAKNEQALADQKWVKVNKTRRSRGYSFEDRIRKRINSIDKEFLWHCRRLGGSSTGLPDLLITYNMLYGVVVAMECKSGKDKNVLEIPVDQILRCIDTLTMFGRYRYKGVCFAFKFGKSELLGRTQVEERYWITYNDLEKQSDSLKKNVTKVSYNLRDNTLTYHLIDGRGKDKIEGSKFHGCHEDFASLVQEIRSLG